MYFVCRFNGSYLLPQRESPVPGCREDVARDSNFSKVIVLLDYARDQQRIAVCLPK